MDNQIISITYIIYGFLKGGNKLLLGGSSRQNFPTRESKERFR